MPGIGFPDVNGVAEAVVIFPADRGSIPGGAVRWFKTAVFTFRIRDRL